LTVYDVLNKLDRDLDCCNETIKRSHRRKTIFHLVKATERKKVLADIKDYILANH